jgi:hypothetical protein
MAYTQTDLEAIRTAIASGVLKVRYADGSEVTYQSLADLLKVEQRIECALAPATTRRNRRSYPAYRNGC